MERVGQDVKYRRAATREMAVTTIRTPMTNKLRNYREPKHDYRVHDWGERASNSTNSTVRNTYVV